MSPLTNRDKKLLGFLAVIIVLFVFVRILILPQTEKYFALDNSILLAEQDKYEMDLKMVSLPGTQKMNEELHKQLEEAAALYYPLMSSQEIDREVTGFLLKYGLVIENLVITMPSAPSDLEPYAASKMAAAQQEEETEQSAEIVQNQIYAAEVIAKCVGTEAQMTELIDFLVNENPSISVTGYSYEKSASAGETGDSAQGVQKILTIGLQLFMYDRAAEEMGD